MLIRKLKAEGICNVFLKEGSPAPEGAIPHNRRMIEVPALVLCGKPLGDGLQAGMLPADGPFRLQGRMPWEANSRD